MVNVEDVSETVVEVDVIFDEIVGAVVEDVMENVGAAVVVDVSAASDGSRTLNCFWLFAAYTPSRP